MAPVQTPSGGNGGRLRKPQLLKAVGRLAGAAAHVGHEIHSTTEYEGRKLYKTSRMLGPGFIAGAADDDAGGIATYSIIGATTGFALAWLMVLSTPMLIVVQRISAQLGNVTRKGLATLIKENFGMEVALLAAALLVIANIATIAADIAGMAVAVEIVTGINFWILVPTLSVIILYIVIYQNFNTIEKALLYLSLILLAYIISGFLAIPDWGAVIQATFVPSVELNVAFLMAAVGLLGTTITPYLFFWQTATEIEAKRTEKQMKRVHFDIYTGMIYSNLISYFIIISAGAILYPHIAQLGAVGNAPDPARFIAMALRPVAGDNAFYLFAAGLFGASVLAIVVLASSTAYVVSETFGWRRGLNKKLATAPKFYAAIGGSIALGILVLASGIKPIDAMYYSQILCGILDPVLLVMLVKLASDEKIMGEHKLTGMWKHVAWATVAIISIFVVFLFKGLLGA